MQIFNTLRLRNAGTRFKCFYHATHLVLPQHILTDNFFYSLLCYELLMNSYRRFLFQYSFPMMIPDFVV